MKRNPMRHAPPASGFTVALAILLASGCDATDSLDEIFNGGDPQTPVTGAPYDLATALDTARLSLHAYQQLDDFLANQAFTLPAPWALRDQFFTDRRFSGEASDAGASLPIGFSAVGKGRIYVVFRGSQTVSDWITNAQFAQVDYPYVANGGMTHRGFTDLYTSVRDAVAASVNEASQQFPDAAVVLTGHSLGGALATLTGPDLRERTGFTPVLYNFAAPRAGNPDFSRRHEGLVDTSWRTVNTNDTVPGLPPNTVVVIENDRPVTYSYDHVRTPRPITFGDPEDIAGSHSLCNYYSALCDETGDPAACKELAEGVDGCQP